MLPLTKKGFAVYTELTYVIIALIGFTVLLKSGSKPHARTQAAKPPRRSVRLTPEQRMKRRAKALEKKAQGTGLSQIERHELYDLYART